MYRLSRLVCLCALTFWASSIDRQASAQCNPAYSLPVPPLAAGDVNNDGIDDLIFRSGDSLFVVAGDSLDTLLTLFKVEAENEAWAYRYVGAGDVNMDNHDDVLVSGYNDPPFGDTAADYGHAFVYSGLDGSLLLTLTDSILDDSYARAITAPGDLNNDGYDDVLVSAQWYDDLTGGDIGKVYAYSGLNGALLWTIAGDVPNAQFGSALGGAGDYNKDGTHDVMIGAPLRPEGGSAFYGRAYIYTGQRQRRYTILTEGNDNLLGSGLSGLGDVNGDGFGDMLVVAPTNSAGGQYAGRIYLILGDSTSHNLAAADADKLITGTVASERLGVVCWAGDVNSDGLNDIVIGSKIQEVCIFFGNTGIDTMDAVPADADMFITGYGPSVSSAGDVNGDGIRDLIIDTSIFLMGDPDGDGLLTCCDPCPAFNMTGDVDISKTLTSADIIGMVNFTFKGGATPQPCEASADVNCSESVTSADIIYMVNHVFKAGPAPCDICALLMAGTWSCP